VGDRAYAGSEKGWTAGARVTAAAVDLATPKALGRADGVVEVFGAGSFVELHHERGPVTCAAVDPDYRLGVSGAADGSLLIFDEDLLDRVQLATGLVPREVRLSRTGEEDLLRLVVVARNGVVLRYAVRAPRR
jgi:hypothetical protein